MSFGLHNALAILEAEKYLGIRQTLEQRWKYSHYVHGRVAYEHGLRCGKDESVCRAIGVAMEVGWAAVLMLDDILDGDDVRFHTPAAWKVYGVAETAMEASSAIALAVASLSHYPEIASAFARSIEETEVISRRLRRLTYDVTLDVLEPMIYSLGAMSVFATTWALPVSDIGEAAMLETCAGQLVNDCNDCFGLKAQRRNYPDIRTHQPTLLSQILINDDASGVFYDAFMNCKEEHLTELSERVKNRLRRDASCVYRYFDSCITRALEITQKSTDMPIKEQRGMIERIESNAVAWKAKIERMIVYEK